MTLYETFIIPFQEYGFMRRALVACIALAIGASPLGLFLMMRRMTLVGDALSHAILPGAAFAFWIAGLSLWPMMLGGLAAGLFVAFLATAITHCTDLKEDSSFTGMYLISLALGVFFISLRGTNIDLMHLLFGNVLAITDDVLLMVVSVSSISLFIMAIFYRSFVLSCVDEGFFTMMGGRMMVVHQIFLSILVITLVGMFQALGTLMGIGLMILPALSARFWCQTLDKMIFVASIIGIFMAFSGLLLSWHFELPTSPMIVLVGGGVYIISIIFGRAGGVWYRLMRSKHYAA